ncbi:hypothetical protein ACK8P5_25645 (plasmid) [Paenibacillus sp. EC2-1]|uniref:hypothetical protein n=1 Tax=Paenibacillus sp. EC2-1 TaxID=3388665 RepID=UPI003BEF33B3
MQQLNSVQQNIYDRIVGPAIKQIAGLRIGVIREIDYQYKLATIVYADAQDKQNVETPNVPMMRQQGSHESGPFVGDHVLVGFFNNDFRKPVILGTIDQLYGYRRALDRDPHPGKGANLSDLYCKREGESWSVG